jgi:hypothetical protein
MRHRLLVHCAVDGAVVEHGIAQPPQLLLSEVVSTHAPLHETRGATQTHVPATHVEEP